MERIHRLSTLEVDFLSEPTYHGGGHSNSKGRRSPPALGLGRRAGVQGLALGERAEPCVPALAVTPLLGEPSKALTAGSEEVSAHLWHHGLSCRQQAEATQGVHPQAKGQTQGGPPCGGIATCGEPGGHCNLLGAGKTQSKIMLCMVSPAGEKAFPASNSSTVSSDDL